MQIDSFNAVLYTSIFLLPGFIINGIIDSINPPNKQSESRYFLKCLFYSIISCGFWSWLFGIIHECKKLTSYGHWIFLALTAILGSSLLGFLIALAKQKEWVQRLAARCKINTINSIPTAWDYFFSKQEPCFVIVTLLDGKIMQGWYGGNSFSSSSSDERDIYIERSLDENWVPDKESLGFYISKDQIKYIEFKRGKENEQ